MPTAVEDLAGLIDKFLKLDGFDGVAEQAALLADFRNIDAAFTALGAGSADVSAARYSRLERAYAPEFQGIGSAFLALDADFKVKAGLGNAVVFLTALNGSEISPSVAADFAKYDGALSEVAQGLGLFADDFLALDKASSMTDFAAAKATVVRDAETLSGEFDALGGFAETVGNDLVTLGGATGATNANIVMLGNDILTLSGEYDALGGAVTVTEALHPKSSHASATSMDMGFTSLAIAIGQGGAGAPIGAAFRALDSEFLKLDASFQHLAGPVAGLLLPAV